MPDTTMLDDIQASVLTEFTEAPESGNGQANGNGHTEPLPLDPTAEGFLDRESFVLKVPRRDVTKETIEFEDYKRCEEEAYARLNQIGQDSPAVVRAREHESRLYHDPIRHLVEMAEYLSGNLLYAAGLQGKGIDEKAKALVEERLAPVRQSIKESESARKVVALEKAIRETQASGQASSQKAQEAQKQYAVALEAADLAGMKKARKKAGEHTDDGQAAADLVAALNRQLREAEKVADSEATLALSSARKAVVYEAGDTRLEALSRLGKAVMELAPDLEWQEAVRRAVGGR
jgi:hypothetical protein